MSHRPEWARDLHYHEYDGHITHDMLDKAYGEYGRSFRKKSDALLFAAAHPGSIVTRLVDYYPSQLTNRGIPLKGMSPHETGWQVTLPRSWQDILEIKVPSMLKLRKRAA